jgi:hypothetical protein
MLADSLIAPSTRLAHPWASHAEAAHGPKEAVQIGGGRGLVRLLLPWIARIFDRPLLLQDEERKFATVRSAQLRLAVEAMPKLVDERQRALAVRTARRLWLVDR